MRYSDYEVLDYLSAIRTLEEIQLLAQLINDYPEQFVGKRVGYYRRVLVAYVNLYV